MLKILMYGWEFPPHISGGLGVACHGIVTGLAEHEVDVSLVLPCVEARSSDPDYIHLFDCRHSTHEFSHYSLNNLSRFITVKSINSLLTPYMTSQSYQHVLAKHGLIENYFACSEKEFFDFHGDYGSNLFAEVIRYALVAGAYAADIEHDVIHAHEWLTILAGIEAKRISNKPLIFHVHALETDRNPSSINQVVFDIEKYGMEQADQIIAVSQYTKDCICKYYDIAAAKVKVVHNGILPQQLVGKGAPKNREHLKNTVLFLGRMTQQKGPYYFIEAASKVLLQRRDVDFVMAGDGDLWRDMVHQVAARRLGARVHFTKFLDKTLTETILERSKVFVMPSVSEPFGLACLEAVAHQVPVILSKQSGVSEVITHGLSVDFWDTDKMARHIISLLDQPVLAQQLAQDSYHQLSNLVWPLQARKIIDLYSEFLS